MTHHVGHRASRCSPSGLPPYGRLAGSCNYLLQCLALLRLPKQVPVEAKLLIATSRLMANCLLLVAMIKRGHHQHGALI